MPNDRNRTPGRTGGFRPARPQKQSGGKPGERKYGKPAPSATSERKCGKPAPSAMGERKYGKPAPSATTGERKYGKPAPSATTGERKYGKPASSATTGERKYGKPTPNGERKFPLPMAAPRITPIGGGVSTFPRCAIKVTQAKNGEIYATPVGLKRHPRPVGKGGYKPGKPVRPAQPVSKVNARRVALDVLTDVTQSEAFAALALDERLKTAGLTQTDKRFCASIVYKTLENLIRIDYVLSGFLEDADSLEPRVRNVLRLSACQILFHDRVPDNAVVDEAVKLTRAIGMEAFTGLTNAVLRNLLRGENDIKYPTSDEGARYLSIMFSVPMWIAQRLMDAYGAAMARDICAYRTEQHFTCIRPNMMRVTDAQFDQLLKKKVWQCAASDVPHAWRVREASDIARDADYVAGLFSIQSESSMMAAQALGIRPGMQVLDCCAAPGGKTAYIAESLQGTGRVYAWDIHDHRVALIRAMMRRLRLDNVRPAVRDAAIPKEDMFGTLDAVLLDAPCSGLGVMDDKPDVKYRVTEESVKELTEIQAKLLDVCCQYVKRGGTLVYSTCSVLPEENDGQIKTFLQNHPEFSVAPLPDAILPRFAEHCGEYGLQLLPHRDNVEGFFIARMTRKG